ncbi:hypothetical protein E0H82_05415 [Acinetobacter sp. ANC 4910]|uniref:hypothetical protein n=1 Tax=Acinetobacter sp. ANC 4910 TaxID=2529850 RepID=UPI0010403797|nr:hypothetical protein [Acinetobacter sp. ANC 4910]TCB36209.1 hypothetical protein E0H82_05415 [Acinetobacter sp. ANC 4910]
MKKILKISGYLLFVFAIGTSYATAATETRVIRAENGQLVSLGDSYIQLVQNMQQPPISIRNYEWEEGRKQLTASDHVYLVGNTYYTVTIVDNVIKKIVWDRKV